MRSESCLVSTMMKIITMRQAILLNPLMKNGTRMSPVIAQAAPPTTGPMTAPNCAKPCFRPLMRPRSSGVETSAVIVWCAVPHIDVPTPDPNRKARSER